MPKVDFAPCQPHWDFPNSPVMSYLPLLGLLLPLFLAECAPKPPPPVFQANGPVVYQYQNTADVGHDNSLDKISVIGYDERGIKEASRLDVTVGDLLIRLRDPYDGTPGGAMYNPSVSLKEDGTLVIRWEQIGETACSVELGVDSSGRLIERRRSVGGS